MELALTDRVVRLETQMGFLKEASDEAKLSREAQLTALNTLKDLVSDMNTALGLVTAQVGTMNSQLASHAPTIQEFIEIKNKAEGAGALGKWLWSAGAVILTVAFNLFNIRELISGLINRILS